MVYWPIKGWALRIEACFPNNPTALTTTAVMPPWSILSRFLPGRESHLTIAQQDTVIRRHRELQP